MFFGLQSMHNQRSVSCFADAQRELARCSKTPTGRARKEQVEGFPLGQHSKSVTWVRETRDGSVAFQLYSTDVVVWHKDGSFTLEAYPTVTTCGFASTFTPAGVSTTKRGLIYYRDGSSTDGRGWRYCKGLSPVRFTETGDNGWTPDPTDLEHQLFRYLVLDRAKAREVSKKYPFADFKTWLELMAGHDVPIYHCGSDQDNHSALEALEQREFRRAAENLPRMQVNRRVWGGKFTALKNIEVSGQDYSVGMGSVDRLRDYLYDDAGAFETITAPTLSYGEFEKHNKRLKQLEKAGVSTYRFGI